MHTPAAAIAWEFWGRHRLGLIGVVGLVAFFAVVCAATPITPTEGFVHSIWFVIALCYVIGIFAFGFDGRLETAESGFPARMFVLPVRTRVLVGLPMVQGMTVAVLLWLEWDYFVLRPSGIETPAWWPVMLAAVVALSQAISWFPIGLPWLRVLIAFAVLTSLIRAHVILALFGSRFADPETQNTVLSLFAIALVPFAFLLAHAGVSRARRGDSPDWLRVWRSIRPATRASRELPAFRSALRSQVWYEWRARGFGFVLTVAFMLLALMAMYALVEPEAAGKLEVSGMLLLIPLLIAPMWGSYAGTSGNSIRSTSLSTFAATRPISCSTFVAAKFRAAALMAAAGYAVVLILLSIWQVYTGAYRETKQLLETGVDEHGMARVAAFCVLLLVGHVLTAWRLLVVNLWAGLTGRTWVLVVQSILIGFVGLQFMYEVTLWNVDLARRERILDALPWIASAVVVLKLSAAGYSLALLRNRGEIGTAQVGMLLGVWLLIAIALFGLLAWLIPSSLIPMYWLALGVVLFLPLARLAVAPLALARNRHR